MVTKPPRIYRWSVGIGLGEVGFSMMLAGGKTVVSSGTHPVWLFLGAFAIAGIWFLFTRHFQVDEIGSAGLARRFLSFVIDLDVVIIAQGSFLALVPLNLEARRTGHFAWSFARDYTLTADAYIFTPLALVGFSC